jgi:hypothetical protein
MKASRADDANGFLQLAEPLVAQEFLEIFAYRQSNRDVVHRRSGANQTGESADLWRVY